MPRVKRGVIHGKKRARILKLTKGYRWGRKNLIKQAITASHLAGAHALADRRKKKNVNRALWQVKINAALRINGLTYSKFIHTLKTKNIELDRKTLATIAKDYPEIFKKIIAATK
ncbi:MAG TPA: 50S ribosomal protein L20 [Patescibacteria group bacterium]|nr:50S ribosomal protein L20 [Patescibacteria group bacterium]